jgi:hypothetical protein
VEKVQEPSNSVIHHRQNPLQYTSIITVVVIIELESIIIIMKNLIELNNVSVIRLVSVDSAHK